MTEMEVGKTSTGHNQSDGKHLDKHFECMKPEYEATLRAVGFLPGWHVLDAGSGGGSFLPLLSELVAPSGQVYALDLAPENVEWIREKARSELVDNSVEAKVGSILELPYNDDQFDAVWCANVIQYLSDPELELALSEMIRVVKPGGRIAIKEVDVDAYRIYGPLDPMLFRRLLEKARTKVPQLTGAFRTTFLRKWLLDKGLEDVNYKTFSGDRYHPLTQSSRAYAEVSTETFGKLAQNIDISPGDKKLWQRLNPASKEYILDDPDFYWRESWALITGIVGNT